MAKQIPVRQCIGCREMKPKKELVRIIRTPEQEICLDKTGKKNGRGAYICQNKACFEKAIKTKGIARALQIEIPDEIYDTIGKELI
ncbi:MAG: YlxR family protein [Eubacteriales bacterium]|nr:YlxR family protein [Lachnospiraceae bacterium]MDO5127744.1 YlxR family protein [Eubacteriales bacterium]